MGETASIFSDTAKRATNAADNGDGKPSVRVRGHGFSRRDESQQPLSEFARTGKFGRLFPDLRPLVPPVEALKELAATFIEPDISEPTEDNTHIPAGYTYFGQFIDHDITFDPTSLQEVLVDPLSLENFRTPMLDLDCLYGAGPGAAPQLYQRADSDLFLIGLTSANTPGGDPTVPVSLPHDLPRSPEGFALIGDPRNDENLIVAQLHLAFMRFHNKVVAGLRDGSIPRTSPIRRTIFDEARELVIWHYQWVVIHDFLDRLLDRRVLADVLTSGRRFYRPEGNAFMPVEFSGAAYRMHSMVREEYNFNRVFRPGGPVVPASLSLLFTFTGLSGSSVPIPSDWIIDWRRFFEVGKGQAVQFSRKIDPFVAPQLHNLPVGGGARSINLPETNLLRGRSLGLPPGQSIARKMGITPLTPDEIATGPNGAKAKEHNLHIETPLWYYLMKEAQIQANGEHLGEVGSRIVAEVFIGLLQADSSSYLRRQPDWTPTLPSRRPRQFKMPDLIAFMGELNPIGD